LTPGHFLRQQPQTLKRLTPGGISPATITNAKGFGFEREMADSLLQMLKRLIPESRPLATFNMDNKSDMQIKLFTIPIGDSGAAQEEMNRFLRGNKILEVENHLISNENGAYWCFCVRYIEKTASSGEYDKTKKVDYNLSEVLQTSGDPQKSRGG